jgi:hypothetical protein
MSGFSNSWEFIAGAGQGWQAFPFGAGWIVRGPGSGLVFVPDPNQQGGADVGTLSILAAISALSAKVDIMSGTLDTATAAIQADLVNLTTAVAGIASDVTADTTELAALQAQVVTLTAELAAGGATPAQLATLGAIDTGLQAQIASLNTSGTALAALGTPPVVTPPAPTTP